MMNKFNQGRFLVVSSRCRYPPPTREKDVFGRPMRVFDAIKSMEKLHDSEKIKYGYLFSELLGLPKPPEISTKQEGKKNKFVVKLVKFEEYDSGRVLREIALAKWDEEVRSMKDFEIKSWKELLLNVPSVIKQGVTEKQAKKIIAKIEAAGGEAVMETLE